MTLPILFGVIAVIIIMYRRRRKADRESESKKD